MHYWGSDLFSVCVDIGWWLFKACIFMCWSFCLPTRQIWETLHLANSKVYIDDLSVFMLLFHIVICFLCCCSFHVLLHAAKPFPWHANVIMLLEFSVRWILCCIIVNKGNICKALLINGWSNIVPRGRGDIEVIKQVVNLAFTGIYYHFCIA